MASQNNMDPPLCAKGCGFYGSLENKNMCSKCYVDYLKQELIAQSVMAFEVLKNSVTTTPTPLPNSSSLLDDHPSPTVTVSGTNGLNSTGSTTTTTTRIRCPCCNKKLGLLGFHCYCGGVFCGEHRYPEKHSCGVDLKTAGREVLAKQNPLCKGDKMQHRI
ncbi:putative zinc finger A20 and AN1 domain-containing stress-associated protein 8 [Rosa chinensis]|nr:putative zinc finger A20 and AN1 domain-containing stress-associated protein 8 [Rosa chinensis]